MTRADRPSFPHHRDERGDLIAVEFDQVPFEVKRIFMVRGPRGGSDRGNHIVLGQQVIILQSGTVSVQLGATQEALEDARTLEAPGEALVIPDGVFIRYHLPDEGSSILVLCERGFVPREH
jgi:hypothetical protein